MKPKYQVGDEVFIVEGGKAIQRKITAVCRLLDRDGFYYAFVTNSLNTATYDRCWYWLEESLFFPSKEELIKSL